MVEVLPKCCMAKVLRGVTPGKGESDTPLYCVPVWLTTFIEDVLDQTLCNTVVVNDIRGSSADVCSSLALFERSIQTKFDQQNSEGENGFVAYDRVSMRVNIEVVRRLWIQGTALCHRDTSPCKR